MNFQSISYDFRLCVFLRVSLCAITFLAGCLRLKRYSKISVSFEQIMHFVDLQDL